MTPLFTFICRQTLFLALTAYLFLPLPAVAQTSHAGIPTSAAESSSAVFSVAGVQRTDASRSVFAPALAQRLTDVAVSEGPDTRLFRTINNAQTQFKTSLFTATDNTTALIVVGVPLGCIIYGIAADDRRVLNTGVLLSASEVLTYGLKHILKITVKRPRPYEDLADVHVNNIGSADEYSFPSGHTAGAFALATMLTLRHPKPIVYIPAFIWAGMVGYGRVYNGVHYPSDVLGGAVLGAGTSVLTFALRGTIIDTFDRVTGRSTADEASFLIVPIDRGAMAALSIKF
ncbi:MAG TPA: phosphatase PAP2 family protein [Bacteroidota bacterium]|nr:phosphatase PAP2 family protein [Bacteroidota bacterium]